MFRTIKNNARHHRAAMLALTLPFAFAGEADAQTTTERRQDRLPQATQEQREREAAAQRVAESYGVLLDTISVYADRGPQPFLEQTQNVTVIDRKTIEERQIRDVQDLVRYEPGVTVSKTTSSVDPFGNLAGFTIRGVSNNRVLELVDGARVIESIQDGNRDFVGIGNLKTVEIIRGPAGVLYGADALGGLVAFVTKDPEDYLKGRNFGGQVDTGYDSYDKTWSKSAAAAFRWGEWSALISATQRSYNEGTLSNADPRGGIWPCPRNPEAIRCNELNPLDGKDYDILGKIVWNPNAEHEVKLITQHYKSDKTTDQRADLGLQAGGIRNLSYIRNQVQTAERYQLIHRYTPNLGWIDQIRWFVAHSPHERDFTGDRRRRLNNGQLDKLDFLLNYKEQFTEGDIQLNSSFNTPFATHKLTYGAYASVTETDYQRRDILTNLTTGAVTVTNAGGFNFADATTKRADGFIQDEIKLFDNRWILTPGIRYATYELDPRPNPFYQTVSGKEPRVTQSERLVKQLGSVWRVNEADIARRPLCGRLQDADCAAAVHVAAERRRHQQQPDPEPRSPTGKRQELRSRRTRPGIVGLSLGHRLLRRLLGLHPEFRAGAERHEPGLLRLHLPEPVQGQHLGCGNRGRISLPEPLDRFGLDRLHRWHANRHAKRAGNRLRRHHAVFRNVRRPLRRSGHRLRRTDRDHMGKRGAGAIEPDALPARRLRCVRCDRQLVAALGAGAHLAGVGAELHRCTLFPFAERRDQLPDRSEHGGRHRQSARTADRAGRTFKVGATYAF